MSIKYKLSRTLLAAALAVVPIFSLSCGNKTSGLESRVIQSDKTLSLARKQIDAEEYSSTIKLLEGYSTNDSGVLAERSFLLGEATIKSISKSHLMALCARGNVRLNEEYAQAIREFRKNYESSQSYFKTAIDLNKGLENRLDSIYLVRNRKLGKLNGSDPKCIRLLKKLVYSIDNGDENGIKEIVNFGFDIKELVSLELKKLEEESAHEKTELERFFPLPRPIDANEREKARWKEEFEINKRLHEMRVKLKIDALYRKAMSIRDNPLSLIKPQLESRGYDIEWLSKDDVVILTSNNDMAELLVIENSGRPELKLKKLRFPMLQVMQQVLSRLLENK